MMVELEISEEPLELPGGLDCVGVDELDAWSEIMTMLVIVWPPSSVVKKAEVTGACTECGVVEAGVFVDGVLVVGVNEVLCSVADDTGVEEGCGVAEGSVELLDEVCSCGDDEDDEVSVGLGVGELFCGTETETP
jgi:hypothetical protein